MRTPFLVLVASILIRVASAQVIPEWEQFHSGPFGAHAAAETLTPIGATGHWYVGGRNYSFVNQDSLPYYAPGGHVLLRLDEQGQIVWSRLWSAQPAPPANSARSIEVAADPSNDARIVYARAVGGVTLERRSAVDGSVVWSTPAPAGTTDVVPGSLAVFPDGHQSVALTRGNNFEFDVYTANGVLQQSSLYSTGIQPSGFFGATDLVSGRVAVAASTYSGVIAVHAADGSVAWSNSAVDMTVISLAFGPGGVLATVGSDSQNRQRFRLYDAAGAILASHTQTGPGPFSQGWFSVKFDAWGSAIAVGRNGIGASIAKFSPLGIQEWSRTWSSANPRLDTFQRVLAGASGEYFAMGTTEINGTFPQETRLLVTAWHRDGTLAWEHIDPPTAGQNEIPAAIAATPLGSIVVAGKREQPFLTSQFVPVGVHVVSLRPQTSAFCFGDAVSTSLCPCGNASAPGAQQGCANSTGVGARIVDSGIASLGSDTLALTISGLPASSTCLVFHAQSANAVVFGDGVRCALGGPVIRLYSAQASAGVATVPPPGGLSLSARSAAAGDPLAAGSVRYLQAFYRNVASFCTPAGFSTSSGLVLTWAP